MNSCSTPRLALIITSALGCIFTFFVWLNEIDRTTFLAQPVLKALWCAVLPLGLSVFLIIKKWGKGEPVKGMMNNIRLFAGAVLMVIFLGYMLLTTLVWLLPGTISTYTAYSEFSAGSRNSCSGVDVNDPDLQRRIKVCEPAGNYFGGGMLSVTKRSTAAGMTIVNSVLKD
ncbi:hypothetical protein N1689_08540 [Pantoea sp. XY16]|uniref:hypothetical protein n=1 Tax=Pantoea sp. XY16 TaxID=2976705 RepID=UPI0021A666F9|nr:hypothetical protein [Pantoea sp. XY16]MCT2417893.1 hypothetical protein [Pantoea sp. XY16]